MVIPSIYKIKINNTGKTVKADKPDDIDIDFGYGEDGDEAPERVQKVRIETLVNKYLEAQTLQVFSQGGLQRAIENFVEKDDTNALKEYVEMMLLFTSFCIICLFYFTILMIFKKICKGRARGRPTRSSRQLRK